MYVNNVFFKYLVAVFPNLPDEIVIRQMIENGASVNICHNFFLEQCIENNCLEGISMFFKYNKQNNIKIINNFSPIEFAIFRNKTQSFEFLLTKKYDNLSDFSIQYVNKNIFLICENSSIELSQKIHTYLIKNLFQIDPSSNKNLFLAN